ncbi:uncharacterized protein BYT42DRAFT_504682 [Radiomyces spectabilis]|uniref:uncharacterized protein n=1 Tax=Radiomyces spectabilis TaxID=64574 RepID=UPI0022203926|nr:uncharacterized protein BYT42DRAFT_504682 [Radiomyces spectabilis]KAI8366790.1 hypothetical protein BYT42DRAFT_504682 [Radiomyces spectabilis]
MPGGVGAPFASSRLQASKEESRVEKLKWFEMVQAMKEGKMPTNAQINEFISRMIQSPTIEARKNNMSAEGQQLLADFRALLQTMQNALATKNKDELFQSLVYHLRNIQPASVNKEQLKSLSTGTDTQEVKQEAKSGGQAIMKIARLVATNSSFRNVVNELISIAQEIFGEATTKASGSLKAAGEQLSAKTEQYGDQMQELTQPEKQEEVTEKMKASAQDTQGTKEQTTEAAQRKRQELQQQLQQKASEQAAAAKDYARQKFPPEKVNDLIERLKAALGEVQQHPDYQSAIDSVIGLFNSWSNRAGAITQRTAGMATEAAQQTRGNEAWSQAELELKTILEDWAQGLSLDPLIQTLKNVLDNVRNDQNLRTYKDDVARYLQRLLKEPNYVTDPASTDDGKALIERGREVTEGRYRGDFDALTTEGRRFTQSIAEDPMAKELNERFTRIHQDLWFDKDGHPAFKPQLLNDMRMTLLPAILEQIKFVPIPRIEYSDPQFDVVIENVILAGDTLLPNILEMKMENFTRFSPKTEVTNVDNQTIFVKMHEIHSTVEDVVFYFKRKTGFPKVSDRGVASLYTGGKGVSLALQLTSNSLDPQHTIKVKHCKCHIDNLKVRIHDSKHNLLYKAATPMVMGIVRRQMAKAIEAKIVESINQGDQKITARLYREKELGNVQSRRARPGLFSTGIAMMNAQLRKRAQTSREKKRTSRVTA